MRKRESEKGRECNRIIRDIQERTGRNIERTAIRDERKLGRASERSFRLKIKLEGRDER